MYKNIFEQDLSKSFLYGAIIIAVLIAVMIMINPVMGFTFTSKFKEQQDGIQMVNTKYYQLNNPQIISGIDKLTYTTGDPVFSIRPTGVSIDGTVVKQTGQHSELKPLLIWLPTRTIDKQGDQTVLHSEGKYGWIALDGVYHYKVVATTTIKGTQGNIKIQTTD